MEASERTRLKMATLAARESMKLPPEMARYLAWIGTVEDMPKEYAYFLRRWHGMEKTEEMLDEALTLTFLDRVQALRALHTARLYMHGKKFAEPWYVSRTQYLVSVREEAPLETTRLVPLKRGTAVLTFGARLSAAIFGLSLAGFLLNPAIGFAGIFTTIGVMLLHAYVFWLETGEAILNPKFLAVGVLAMVGLALTALLSLVPM